MCQAFPLRVCFLADQSIKRWLRCWHLQKRPVMMITGALTTRHSFGNIADTLAILLRHKFCVAIQVAWIVSHWATFLCHFGSCREFSRHFVLEYDLTCTKRAIWLANTIKRCDTSCREGVTLRNVGKIPCNVAKRVAESRAVFYFSQRLRQQKNCDKYL